jgi:hypothetical protein
MGNTPLSMLKVWYSRNNIKTDEIERRDNKSGRKQELPTKRYIQPPKSKEKFGNTNVEIKQPQLQYVEFLDCNSVSLNM